MGRHITVPYSPQRIVSLVPSQTELLLDLGVHSRLAGRTRFCIHPEEAIQQIPRIGGTKQIDFQRIREINPDLIIGNKEENEREQIEMLAQEFPVWMSDITSTEDALKMIVSIGELVNLPEAAEQITLELQESFQRLQNLPPLPVGKVLYFIWYNPWMVAGKNTFIDHMLELAGMQNACNDQRYPVWNGNSEIKADLLLFSSEPFPFKIKHLLEMRAIYPDAMQLQVDGEMFSWYGSRLRHFENYVLRLREQIKKATHEEWL